MKLIKLIARKILSKELTCKDQSILNLNHHIKHLDRIIDLNNTIINVKDNKILLLKNEIIKLKDITSK